MKKSYRSYTACTTYLLRAQPNSIYLMADLRQNMNKVPSYCLLLNILPQDFINTLCYYRCYTSPISPLEFSKSNNIVRIKEARKICVIYSSIKLGTKILTSNQINNLADHLPQKPDTIFIFQIYMYQISICDLRSYYSSRIIKSSKVNNNAMCLHIIKVVLT